MVAPCVKRRRLAALEEALKEAAEAAPPVPEPAVVEEVAPARESKPSRRLRKAKKVEE